MVNINVLALWAFTGMSVWTRTEQARGERSILGRKVSKDDHIRVQQARLDRLERKAEKMSADSALLAERARQHRDMRLKSTSDLRIKVEALKTKLREDRERLRAEVEEKLTTVREETWAQAAKDRDALETELRERHREEQEILLEEERERAGAMVENVTTNLVVDAEKDRELYARRAALAQEGQELALKERKQLQIEKDALARQLEETKEVEDVNRKKIIIKFKARENALRKNFEAKLREAKSAVNTTTATAASVAESPRTMSKSSRPLPKSLSSSKSGVAEERSKRAAIKSSGSSTCRNSGLGRTSVPTSAGPTKTS